ncbi:hypothetical protein AB9T89_09705 [Flavobacterium oncorhynchi]|uniref:hypothetical protein n=1 Tax=Flavobacterium oncorhynchi TaxID=728056 RepID=UPI00351A0A01
MQHYYNFTVSENQISYDPYWYDNSNLLLHSFLGIIILIPAIITSYLDTLKCGLIFSILIIAAMFILSTAVFIRGIYIWKIKNKTTFIFDKNNGAFYKITPFSKKKIIALSDILSIVTKSDSRNFNYILKVQNKASAKNIYLTSDIKNENQNNPEIRFLEMEIIPQLESFLNLKKEGFTVFDSELINI